MAYCYYFLSMGVSARKKFLISYILDINMITIRKILKKSGIGKFATHSL